MLLLDLSLSSFVRETEFVKFLQQPSRCSSFCCETLGLVCGLLVMHEDVYLSSSGHIDI